ncbi:MAG: alpha-amylase family glycosyl hydrolase [Actinomycetota bacterium]|nr:alpha-amylase family glycosyl hydrolase [Actinomycetota bacterium]
MALDAQDRTAGRLAGTRHPSIYEINTWPWLAGLSARHDRPVDLANVPAEVWDDIAGLGFDAVWLMGVWERSPAGITIARSDASLMASFRAALGDLVDADIIGSPYCIRDYRVDLHLGGRDGLATARARLAERGVGLVLDFVPNHVAPDHPWTATHPERFVRGTDADVAADPTSFTRLGTHGDDHAHIVARGRDPYFPAWPDVVQLNAFSPDLRAAVVDTLADIADQCDGVRCDMAMLVRNEVFARTWGHLVGAAPDEEYWTEVIGEVRRRYPGFWFIAEAYWDMEWDLQQLGFDHCYDKRLYDRLVAAEPAESIRLHLCADGDYQDGLVRFVENHDEPRAASALAPERLRAATVTTLTQRGARLVHDGQLSGRRVHLPVFLGRFPDEEPDPDLEAFHRALLAAIADRTFHDGTWRLCEREGWGEGGDDTWTDLVAWSWDGATRWVVIVNLAATGATGRVRFPWDDLRARPWRLVDPTSGDVLRRAGDDLVDGVYVSLEPWAWHLWRVEPDPEPEAAT